MKHVIKKPNRKGFTIIELMVATLVFSVVLLVILTAFIQISRMYYKGVNMTRMQEDARTVIQDMSDDIKFARSAPSSGPGYYCIGLHKYQYQKNYQLDSSGGPNNYGIRRYTLPFSSGCSAAATSSDYTELLDSGMQLNNLDISCDGGICRLQIHLLFYGGTPEDLFHSPSNPSSGTPWKEPDAECTGSLEDSQYCATADYGSAVLQRS
ncbi:MAG TPA: prepilin-type N-terminal cleavage/methylation domain-containing protein [Candidatus Saccharimonadales bacterium]|nr:prepilin-type N-terminal cleavage/methylation domain-containing protein [Candidatus Saccharimonadales bacterium]